MDEAETLCDRLVVINRGQIIAQGTPDEIRGGHRFAAADLARRRPLGHPGRLLRELT